MSSEMDTTSEDGLEEVKMEFGGHNVDCNYLDRDFDPNSITDIKLSPDVLCKNVLEKLKPGPGIMTIKEEFDVDGNHGETDLKNIDEWNVGPETNDTGVETKPSLPLYNLYPTNMKEEVNDPSPPVFSLTSVLKSEFRTSLLNTPYFDHSSVIMQNLKTEAEDVDGNCEDPLGGGEAVALRETPETYFQGLAEYSIAKVQSGEESKCRFCKESYSGKGKICEKCSTAAPVRIEDKMGRTGNKKKPLECDTCGKCFALPSRLTRHKVTHSGEKIFKCETCGKWFARNADLTSHKRIHSGERPYLCEKCGKGFVESSHLTKHKLTHLTEERLKCVKCEKCFKWKNSLAAHMITHR